jgi:hypothetical protein
MRTLFVALFVAFMTVAGLAACSKPNPSGSGDLSAPEAAGVALLPKSSTVLVGGSYSQIGKLLGSDAVAKVIDKAEGSMTGLKAWLGCFAAYKDVTFIGAFASSKMRMVMGNLTIDRLEQCAATAKLTATVDPDRKFIAIAMPGRTEPVGYLAVPGGVYSRQDAAKGDAEPVGRAVLEAELAATATENATQNTALLDLAKRVDRARSIWFAGSGAGTPVEKQVGELFGTIDLADGVAVQVEVAVLEDALAEKAMTGFDQLKLASGMLGKELGAIIDEVKLTRDGKRLRLQVKLTPAQLEVVASQLIGRLGGLANGL